MPRVIAFFLIIIVLLPSIGYWACFEIRQHSVKRQIKRQIKRSIPVHLQISMRFAIDDLARLDWKNDHEFRLNGQMFDILSHTYIGDSVHYRVLWDSEESALFAELDDMLHRFFDHDPIHRGNQTKLVSFYHSLFFEDHSYQFMTNDLNAILILSQYNYHITDHLDSCIPAIDCPPPEAIA